MAAQCLNSKHSWAQKIQLCLLVISTMAIVVGTLIFGLQSLIDWLESHRITTSEQAIHRAEAFMDEHGYGENLSRSVPTISELMTMLNGKRSIEELSQSRLSRYEKKACGYDYNEKDRNWVVGFRSDDESRRGQVDSGVVVVVNQYGRCVLYDEPGSIMTFKHRLN